MSTSLYWQNASQRTAQLETQNVSKLRRVIRACAFCAIVLALSIALVTVANGQNSQTPTNTSLVSSLNPSTSGQSVAFTATVTMQGTGTPTGTLTFLQGFQGGPIIQLGQVALGANGQAQLTTTALRTLGGINPNSTVQAIYGGDANFALSTGTIIQTVLFPPRPVSLSVSPSRQTLILGGNSQQYTATGHYSDGSSLDLTFLVSWSSSNPAVATINESQSSSNSPGLASAVGVGNTAISAIINAYGVASPPAALGVELPGPSVLFLGGGSSAMFLELGQASQSSSITATPCVWTKDRANLIKNLGVWVSDDRPSVAPNGQDFGDMWITWSPGSGACAAPAGNFNIYAYTSLDSVTGVRCYFEVDTSGISGCVQHLNTTAGTPGQNLLCNGLSPCVYGPDTPIPQAVMSALDQKHWFAAGTDILPQDAKFAIYRMLQPCGQVVWRQPFDQGLRGTYGFGYQGSFVGIGGVVLSHFSQISFNTLDFNFSGRDPINTAMTVPDYSVSTLGAKPIIVTVSPGEGAGLGEATDINGFSLALFADGTLGRTTDLIGPTVSFPVTTLINEPLSGAYNVMEYSIPNSSQFHTSQDANNCNGSGGVFSNAMNLQSADGNIPAFRVRAVGTSEMIHQIQAATPTDQRLGYFYWSAANAASFTAANGKYLTVNGVDPLQDAYTDGVLPGVDSAHPLSNVSFEWVNMGDYPIWSVVRIISQSQTPVGVASLILAAQALNSSQHNFISPGNLQIWHSHYYLPAIGTGVAALGICGESEFGGDSGSSNISKEADFDFCTDFGNYNGLINKAN